MHLAPHHRLALVPAAATSAIALFDAATNGLTDHDSIFADGSDVTAALVVGSIVHGLTYLTLGWVLVREAERFRSTNRVARASRWVVLPSLAVLGVGFLFVAPAIELQGGSLDGGENTAFAAVGTPAFFGMILGALVMGLALLRNGSMGIGGRLLALMLPMFGVTLLLAWLAPAWAHPAYLEATLNFGIALLGVGAAAPALRRSAREVAPAL
jgi:hypothetical protein